MAPTQEPIAVLGIGTMGHGMATSALRAGIPTIVWNREPEATRDLADLGAEVAAHRGRCRAASGDRRHDGDRRRRRDVDRPRPGHARGAGAGRDLGADEHDRRRRDRAGRGPRGAGASRHHVPRRAGLGEQGARRAGRADDLRVGPRRGTRPGHSPLRRARAADRLGRPRRERHAPQAREQHLARVRRRSGGRVGRTRAPVGTRRPRRSPTRSAKARSRLRGRRPSCNAFSRATSRRSFRWRSRSRTCTSRSKRPTRIASPRSPAWPTNGSRSSIKDSAIKTSPS